jgi:hypothetical protein
VKRVADRSESRVPNPTGIEGRPRRNGIEGAFGSGGWRGWAALATVAAAPEQRRHDDGGNNSANEKNTTNGLVGGRSRCGGGLAVVHG